MSISINNPIIQRELIGILRSRRALAAQIVPAIVFSLLVITRWPTDARVDLTGSQSRQVLQLFGYGVLATLLLVVPAFPATAIVREKSSGTLALVLNSPMSPWSIYFGKFIGALVFVFLPLAMSVPAAAACYAMGGVSLSKLILPLYGLFALITVQYTALALCVSSRVNSTDSALRMTYGITLVLAVVLIGPHLFLQGKDWGSIVTMSLWLRSVSPIPAVMELLGQGDVGGQGLIGAAGYPFRFTLIAAGITVTAMLATIVRLTPSVFDKPRPQGVITDDRSTAQQWLRRLIFLIDPQRRTGSIGPLTNPIMVKEFRCRRFGRSHWLLRLVAICAVASLGLTYTSTAGTLDWGVETIGGILVVLQVALIVLITPSLAAGLISSERETGGWTLLRMTPLSAGQIVRGKLMSAIWPLILILCATFPGYAVMIYIQPSMTQQITHVFFSLLLTALFALLSSAAVGSLFARTASATVAAYVLLLGFCGVTMLFWLGRDSTFGHSTVEAMLTINPLAAALSVMQAPGFAQYDLVPASWWFLEASSIACLFTLGFTTWRLTRPQ